MFLLPGCHSVAACKSGAHPEGSLEVRAAFPLIPPALSLLVVAANAMVWVGVLCSFGKELVFGEGSRLPGSPQSTPSGYVMCSWEDHLVWFCLAFLLTGPLHCCRINGHALQVQRVGHLLSMTLPGGDWMEPSGEVLAKGQAGLGLLAMCPAEGVDTEGAPGFLGGIIVSLGSVLPRTWG